MNESSDLENRPIIKSEDFNKDGRLFPGIPLYCEGAPKPLLRGLSHLLVAISLLLFGLYHLYIEANNNVVGQVAGVIYVLSNIFCYGISGIYHLGRWGLKTEILIQKLDHCGIVILGCGTMIPVAFLLLPPLSGALLFFFASATCGWACWNIINLRPSITRLVLNGSTLIPFLPQLYFLMDSTEYTATLLVFVFQILGLLVFMAQRPDPWPSVFGYHEIFHLFVICAGTCVYIVNWGVIRRTCNMYHPRSILDDMNAFLSNISGGS